MYNLISSDIPNISDTTTTIKVVDNSKTLKSFPVALCFVSFCVVVRALNRRSTLLTLGKYGVINYRNYVVQNISNIPN